MRTAALRVALCAPLVLAGGAACAQVGLSVAFLSDYRYRGVSLSDQKPTLRLGIDYDDPSGWYGGLSFVGVEPRPDRRQLESVGYAGYAGRLSDSLGWEAGATAAHFGIDSIYDYQELFAGVQGDGWNVRLHYSPDYFGSGARTVYGEVNAGMPLSPLVRATAHLGTLMLVADAPAGARRQNVDASVGLAVARDAWELRLDLVVANRSTYSQPYGAARGALVLGASLAY